MIKFITEEISEAKIIFERINEAEKFIISNNLSHSNASELTKRYTVEPQLTKIIRSIKIGVN